MTAQRGVRAAGASGRFVLAVLGLSAVMVGVPWLCGETARRRFGSWRPLQGVDAPWRWSLDRVRSRLTEELTDDIVVDVLLRLALCVAWIACAVVLASVVVEVIHMVRHQGIPMPHVRGLGWSQGIARAIAAGLLGALAVFADSIAVAAPLTSAPAVVMEIRLERDDGRSRIDGAPPMSAVRYVGEQWVAYSVRPGDSVYGIAQRLVGSDEAKVRAMAERILDANLGSPMPGGVRFTNPAYIEIGWTLQVPATTTARPPADRARTNTDHTVHVVERGDTLWQIADDTYGDPTEWPRIWEANAGEAMIGGRVFEDPNLIVVGWQLDVPDDAGSLTVAVAPDGPTALVPAPETRRPDVILPAPEAKTTTTDAPAAELSTIPVTVTAEAAAAPVTSRGSSNTATVSPLPARVLGNSGERSSTPAPIGIGGAALLSAGVLSLVAVRRRASLRASSPRARVPTPPPDVVATERTLRTLDAGERLLRVDVAIRAAASTLGAGMARVLAAFAGGDGTVELLLSMPVMAHAPFVGDGDRWVLPASVPVESVAPEARSVGSPCVALTQLGVDDGGRDLLVDVEALGSLAIDASPELADDVVRAIGASLATSVFAEVAHLIAVGVPEATFLGHRHQHHVDNVDAAIELAAGLVGTLPSGSASTFALRARHTAGEAWEPAVIIVASAHHDPTAAARLGRRPGRGIALVTAGREGDAAWTLVGSAGAWRLEPAGLAITPIGLGVDDIDALHRVVRHADVLVVDDGAIAGPGAAAEPGGDTFVEPDWRLLVRLVGGVEVVDRAGQATSFERSKALELVCWLTLHRDRATRAGARTALWELDVRDATFANVVSDARRGMARIVVPPAGEEWLARTMTEELPLHGAVVSDVELIAARLDHARRQRPELAIATLRPALELVRGLPFAGTGYLWPDAEGITSNVVLLATSAAIELAEQYLSVGDVEGVFWATDRGLRVLAGHEELIGLRMRAHARAGDLAGVRREWESYERVLTADPWSDGEPAPKLVALRKQLLSPRE